MQRQNRSTLWFVGRILMPSLSSLVGSMLVMLTLVGFHLLLLSNQADLFLPHVAGQSNDQLAEIYESTILGPLNNLFGSGQVAAISTAFVWGLTGFVIYTVLDFLVTSLREWRQSDEDIAIVGGNKVVRHPMHNQIVIRILWRFLLSVVAVAGLVALQPVISGLFDRDIAVLKSTTSAEMLRHLGVIVVGWLLILHAYVVLFRLFVFRTRVFGEIIY